MANVWIINTGEQLPVLASRGTSGSVWGIHSGIDQSRGFEWVHY